MMIHLQIQLSFYFARHDFFLFVLPRYAMEAWDWYEFRQRVSNNGRQASVKFLVILHSDSNSNINMFLWEVKE